MPTSGGGMPWLPMPIRDRGMPPVLTATAEPVEEMIKNIDETVMNSSLAPDLIDTEPEVLEYDAMTTKSTEIPS